jgi:ParB/RepB/Spo0J family partition protein
MTTATQERRVPLAKLEVAPENARYGRAPVNIDALAANIKLHGLLQPLVGYEAKGKVLVCAGARRLAALKACGAFDDAPVLIRKKDEAIALSVAENDQRIAMHPAEEAKAWKAMLDKGGDLTAIANAFGKSERFVEQRVKLASLHPPIFEAFAKDEIDLDTVEAYAAAPEERQPALWKRFGKTNNDWSIRNEIAKGKLQHDDPIAKFVGAAAYLAAGGRIERDLFDENDEDAGIWIDRDIADKCAAAKLEEVTEKLKKEGWGFVEVTESLYGNEFVKVTFPTQSKDAKAKCGALIRISTYAKGGYEVVRGMAKRGSAAAKAKAAKPKAGKAGVQKGGVELVAPPITNTAHEQATRVASRVVGRAIADSFEVALVAMTTALVRIEFETDDDDDCYDFERRVVNIEAGKTWGDKAGDKPLTFISDGAHQRARDAWRKKLPKQFDATLERELNKWRADDVEALFAFCVGERIRHVETSPSPDPEDARREILAVLGRAADAQVNDHWTPHAAWLMGLSREELDKAAREVGVVPTAKKGATAEAVAAAAADKGWTPALVRELVGEIEPAKKAAPKKAVAKKRGKVLAANTKRAPRLKMRACSECGCTDDRACDGGCYWVGPNLCSACA